MRNLAIIPARCGSKGLKDKNIRLLAGRPLLAHSVSAALDSGIFDEVMVSTDSELYAKKALECGASVPWLRSPELSTDTAGSWDVVKSELLRYQNHGMLFDTVCLLQPTSPLRTSHDIVGSYELLVDSAANAVTSVCEVDHSPLWTMTLDDTLSLAPYREKMARHSAARRQDLPPYYRINGAIYIRRVCYESEVCLLSDPEVAFIMSPETSVDIDRLMDFCMAEALLTATEETLGEIA